jgi:hypothetical protein
MNVWVAAWNCLLKKRSLTGLFTAVSFGRSSFSNLQSMVEQACGGGSVFQIGLRSFVSIQGLSSAQWHAGTLLWVESPLNPLEGNKGSSESQMSSYLKGQNAN